MYSPIVCRYLTLYFSLVYGLNQKDLILYLIPIRLSPNHLYTPVTTLYLLKEVIPQLGYEMFYWFIQTNKSE